MEGHDIAVIPFKNIHAEVGIIAMKEISEALFKAMTEEGNFHMDVDYDAKAPAIEVKVYSIRGHDE